MSGAPFPKRVWWAAVDEDGSSVYGLCEWITLAFLVVFGLAFMVGLALVIRLAVWIVT